MIQKFTFDKCNGFNEKYNNSFEGIELNLKCLLLGLENYCNYNLISLSYDNQKINNYSFNSTDYTNLLLPFFTKNINSLSNKIDIIQK